MVQFTTSNVDETPRETSNYGLVNVCCSHFYLCDVLCDLVPFVQFKKREKHPWRSVTFRLKVIPNREKHHILLNDLFDVTQSAILEECGVKPKPWEVIVLTS